MGLKIANLSELSQADVDQAYAELSQLLRERHPEVDLTRGVFDSIVAYLSGGISGGVNQTEVNRVLQSRSLLAISQNPQLADPVLTDHVLSNFNVVRKAGTHATGTITVIVADDLTTVIPAGTRFVANGVAVTPDAVYTARPTGSVLTAENDRLLQPLGDGRFTFSFPGTAELSGPTGNVKRSTTFVPDSIPGNYVTAYAGTDFSGGTAEELNAELIARQQEGIAAKVMQGRVNIVALLKEEEAFKDCLAFSIVGMSNPEMHRDQHGIIPMSGGGRVDIYARTTSQYQTISLLKEAVLVDIVAGGGVWQLVFDIDEAAGVFEVEQVLLPSDDPAAVSSFEVFSDTRGFNLSGDGVLPDIVNSAEAAYSEFQTMVIRFIDGETPTTGLTVGASRASYNVAIRTMPLIAGLQEYCRGSGLRNLMGDVLVKAPVPCFLTLNFDIQQGAGETPPDLDAIKNDLLTRVNGLGFPGQLHASTVYDVIHEHLTSRQAVRNIDMHGRIRQPNGAMKIIRATDVLTIPDDPGNLVSPRTTAFFLTAATIGASVVTEGFEANS